MAADDVAVIRQAFDAFAAGDLDAWHALTGDDFALYPRREEPGVKERYDGWDGMLEYLANWYSGWESYATEPERYIDCGTYVIVDVREAGVAKQTGIRVEQNFAHAFAVREGKVTEWRMFGPVAEAMAALDVSEVSAQRGGDLA
jgi:ketosteroid isomerase-like protein